MREDSPLGQERGGTLEKGAQGKYLASPLPFSRSLGFGMSPLAGAAAGPLAGADSQEEVGAALPSAVRARSRGCPWPRAPRVFA